MLKNESKKNKIQLIKGKKTQVNPTNPQNS